MKLITARALLEDARQQVLDNTVFRLLVILTAVPILLTFVVGFREDHISLLWGFKTFEYEPILEVFGGLTRYEHPNELFIQRVQQIAVAFLGGTVGVIFCIAATAFFTPRTLEKGAADTLFAKPVSRISVLLSRYFAGILFVGLVAVVMVVGMYLGLLLNSGYNDPGFLWGVVTLMYLYSLLHAFSVFVAVLTRSSTAAILLTLILFVVSGSVHLGWMGVQFLQAQRIIKEHVTAEAEDESEEEEEGSKVVTFLLRTLDTFHYALPKTGDADFITEKLRKALTEAAPQVETGDGQLLIRSAPEGFVLVEGTADRLEQDGVAWVADTAAGGNDGEVRVRRYQRPTVEEEKDRKIPRRETATAAAKRLIEGLEARGTLESKPELDHQSLSQVHLVSVTWTEAERSHERIFFQFDEWMYELDFDISTTYMEAGPVSRWRRSFLWREDNVVLGGVAGLNPADWYRKTFSWNAPWKFNIFFSIGSSLAFALLMLFFAWLKLRRIDF